MLKSYRFWFIVMVVGVLLYVVTPSPVLFKSMNKSASPHIAQVPFYDEMKFWASLIGQVMAGLGGLGVIVKGISTVVKFIAGIFKKKP